MFGPDGFVEVQGWLWVESDDPSEWRYKRRNTILGVMHAHKLDLWEQYTLGCPHREEDVE